MIERCQCCNRPKGDEQALNEILETMQADGAERTQRLSELAGQIRSAWQDINKMGER